MNYKDNFDKIIGYVGKTFGIAFLVFALYQDVFKQDSCYQSNQPNRNKAYELNKVNNHNSISDSTTKNIRNYFHQGIKSQTDFKTIYKIK